MRKTILILTMVFCAAVVRAQEPQKPEPIADNSFLIEEAYNQEAGVVQHINTFMRLANGDWTYSFTQEWPVGSIKHQFSVTAIGMQLGEGQDRHRGAGDLAFNYRYQLKGGDSEKLVMRWRRCWFWTSQGMTCWMILILPSSVRT